MSTRGQFNTKNPTIKRILKEASELASTPSPDYHAEPLESNLFEWHFTLRGPPAPSPYAAGLYHGRIVLPPTYPLRPPSFRFLTPTGRFEVNREICLSISGHHEETWQPAWGIRTALVAIRSFMDTDAKGQLGGIECDRKARERFAEQSAAWKCGVCGKSNGEVMREVEERVAEAEKGGAGRRLDEHVPEELRLAYREELEGKGKERATGSSENSPAKAPTPSPSAPRTDAPASTPAERPAPTRTVPVAPAPQLVQVSRDNSLAWIDACIYGVVAVLLFMVVRRFA